MKTNFKKLTPYAKSLRKTPTKAEIKLWSYVLSNGKLDGHKFLRQRALGDYIVDFVCRGLKLVIEVDGFTHTGNEAVQKDIKRDEKLKELGYAVLRFSHNDIMNNLEGVRLKIKDYIKNNLNPTEGIPPTPLSR